MTGIVSSLWAPFRSAVKRPLGKSTAIASCPTFSFGGGNVGGEPRGHWGRSCDLSFGKLGLNSRHVLTQFWVCLHAPLEPGDRFADHRIIQVANQPAQFSKTQPRQTVQARAPHRDPSRRAAPRIHPSSALWSAPARLQFVPNRWRGSEREAAVALADCRGPAAAHFRRSRGSPARPRLISSMGTRAGRAAPISSAAAHPSKPSPARRAVY
jgi:hypothetical protein